MTNAAPSAPEQRRGPLRRWLSGIVSKQKAMASSERREQVIREAKDAIAYARSLKVAPTRVESFEAAVQRNGYSEEHLAQQLRRHKNVHLALYAAAGALMVWALHLGLTFRWYFGVGAFLAAGSVAVNGYLHGFRAWQIEHRNLIRLQDALRIPGTYLVL